mmetsp:Transcript_19246/g.28409  ORF Transcript_19246/g.28409 Transcript_19246/m.28409 type:complete len:243 (-) Transcript_19246:1159-1887(-)
MCGRRSRGASWGHCRGHCRRIGHYSFAHCTLDHNVIRKDFPMVWDLNNSVSAVSVFHFGHVIALAQHDTTSRNRHRFLVEFDLHFNICTLVFGETTCRHLANRRSRRGIVSYFHLARRHINPRKVFPTVAHSEDVPEVVRGTNSFKGERALPIRQDRDFFNCSCGFASKRHVGQRNLAHGQLCLDRIFEIGHIAFVFWKVRDFEAGELFLNFFKREADNGRRFVNKDLAARHSACRNLLAES